ncbi:MAG: hypothetical protein GX072_04875 [Lysinibacillus sp.]|nr:hypothetical protein [Lysinibacillus sp.]
MKQQFLILRKILLHLLQKYTSSFAKFLLELRHFYKLKKLFFFHCCQWGFETLSFIFTFSFISMPHKQHSTLENFLIMEFKKLMFVKGAQASKIDFAFSPFTQINKIKKLILNEKIKNAPPASLQGERELITVNLLLRSPNKRLYGTD